MDNLKIFILSLKLDSSVNLGLALYQVLVLEIQSKNILLLFVVSCTLSLVQTHKVPCNFQVIQRDETLQRCAILQKYLFRATI